MILFVTHLFLKLLFMITASFIYPIAYLLRWYIRTGEVLVPNYLYKWRKGWFWLWVYLNDSEYSDGTYTEYGDSEKYCPKWVWNSKSDFLKSYWFNAIRNNAVNHNTYKAKIIIGKYVDVYKHYGNNKNFFELRRFENKILPAIQFYLFDKKFFFGYGKSSRLWIEIFK